MCFAACGGVYAGAGYTKETVVEAGTYRLGNEPHPQGFSLRMRDAALSSAPLLPSIQQEVPQKGREPSRGTFFTLCHPRWLEAASPPSFRFFTAYMMAAPPERTIRTTPAATCALFRRHRSWGTRSRSPRRRRARTAPRAARQSPYRSRTASSQPASLKDNKIPRGELRAPPGDFFAMAFGGGVCHKNYKNSAPLSEQ